MHSGALDPEGPSSRNPRIVLIVCVITKCRQVSMETCYTGLSWQRDHKMTEQPMIFKSLEGGALPVPSHIISGLV